MSRDIFRDEDAWQDYQRRIRGLSPVGGDTETKTSTPATPVASGPPTEEERKILAQFCEWRVADSTESLNLRQPITYFVTRKGLMEVRRLPFGILTAPATEPMIEVPVMNLKEGLELSVPRLPWTEFVKIVAFFRAVSKEHKAEAIVQVFYREGAWMLHVPKQKVGGAHIDHAGNFDPGGDFTHLMDIHSHVNMPGFFSGTDDADEKRAVRLYGVIGKIDSKVPESRWRCWTGREFINLSIEQVVDIPDEQVMVPVAFSQFLKEGNTEVKASLHDSLNPFRADDEFPAGWLTQVERESVGVGQTVSGRWIPGQGYVFDDDDAMWQRAWANNYGDHRIRGTGFGGRLIDHRQEVVPFDPDVHDRDDALRIAALNSDKLVYLVHGARIWRAEADGTFRQTSMTINMLNAQHRAHKDRFLVLATTKGEDSPRVILPPTREGGNVS